ncbi:MAG: DUF423 domain-containing protein [Myxococcaceae bacterium]
MFKPLGIVSAVMGFLGVALGAMGAHALKHGGLLGEADGAQRLEWWETAARYQLFHALAIGLAAVLAVKLKTARVCGWLFTAGIVLFSGSLDLMTLTANKAFAAATPLGGICLMAGWIALAVAVVRQPQS